MEIERITLEGMPPVFLFSLDSGSEQRLSELTPAEQEVARGILEGRSNQLIARRRGTSLRTVANQVAALFQRFDVSSRAELVRALEGLPPVME